MRRTIILFLLTGLILSCNNSETNKVSTDTKPILPADTSKVSNERQILIEELRRIQMVFATNDREKIAGLFNFPIQNEIFGIYLEDSTFNEQLAQNGNMVTRQMFTTNYPAISESLQIDLLNKLFLTLSIDKLLEKDTLEYEAIIKTEPCYHFYGIKIENNNVTLTVGTNSNSDFKSKTVSEDEIPENDSSICEHVLWWIFRFDGKKLYFREISGAG